MKRSFLVMAALGLVFGYTACERQKWEDSRVLHMKHEHEHAEGEKKAEGADKKAH
ncbi:hypothetical protein N9260_01945 [bacterium]|nr:hypothetical protein [bacterium]